LQRSGIVEQAADFRGGQATVTAQEIVDAGNHGSTVLFRDAAGIHTSNRSLFVIKIPVHAEQTLHGPSLPGRIAAPDTTGKASHGGICGFFSFSRSRHQTSRHQTVYPFISLYLWSIR